MALKILMYIRTDLQQCHFRRVVSRICSASTIVVMLSSMTVAVHCYGLYTVSQENCLLLSVLYLDEN